jgi:hypothetical protein
MKCYSGGNVGHFWTTFLESKTVNVPVVYITWGLIILIAGKSISRAIGRGGTQKTEIFRAHPSLSNGPSNEFVPFIFMSKLHMKKQVNW